MFLNHINIYCCDKIIADNYDFEFLKKNLDKIVVNDYELLLSVMILNLSWRTYEFILFFTWPRNFLLGFFLFLFNSWPVYGEKKIVKMDEDGRNTEFSIDFSLECFPIFIFHKFPRVIFSLDRLITIHNRKDALWACIVVLVRTCLLCAFCLNEWFV